MKTKGGLVRAPRKHRLRKLVAHLRRKTRDGWHWFDHPEMQARIAQAEADRREGRVKKFDSREDAFAYLDGLV